MAEGRDPRVLAALVAAFTARMARLEEQAVASVAGVFLALGHRDWYTPSAVGAAAAGAGARAAAGTRTMAALTDAFTARSLVEVGAARTVQAAGPVATVTPLRTNVGSWRDLYGRVAETYRLEVSRGTPPEEALQRAATRAEAMVRTDLALARQQQAHRTLHRSRHRIIGYRRVIRPYMSQTGTCGLCIAAADRLYTTDQLMPLHARCQCIVLPATRSNDPGGTYNDEDLAEVLARTDGNQAKELVKVRYVVREHGELGPVLANAEHNFRGPADVAADTAA